MRKILEFLWYDILRKGIGIIILLAPLWCVLYLAHEKNKSDKAHEYPRTKAELVQYKLAIYQMESKRYKAEVFRIRHMPDSALVMYLSRHVSIGEVRIYEPKVDSCNCILDDDQ